MAGFWYLLLDMADWMNFLSRMGWTANRIYDNALIYDSTKHDVIFNDEKIF